MEGEVKSLKNLFDAFCAADSAQDTLRNFEHILQVVGCTSAQSYSYPRLRDAVKPVATFGKRVLFDLLDSRLKRCGHQSVEGTVVIAGAGPVGLRSAMEAKLAGVRTVICYEVRDDCSRHNILKTWAPTFDDAVSLGLAVYSPVSKHSQVVHAGTRELQLCYLKSGLLLGVQVTYGVGIKGVMPSPSGNGKFCAILCPPRVAKEFWRTRSAQPEELPAELSLQPNTSSLDEQRSLVDFIERAQSQNGALFSSLREGSEEKSSPDFDAIFDAMGEQSFLCRNMGFDRKVSRYGPAVGIVVNAMFVSGSAKGASGAERKLPEFIVSRSASNWKTTCLGILDQEGIALENMEYMRGSTHFCVATARFESLLALGVINEAKQTIKESLSVGNVDLDKLQLVARRLLCAAGVPFEAPLASSNGVHLFDFSCKGKLTRRLRWLSESCCLLPVGDALQNPYWPQGLGINKGLHSGCDAVHTAICLVTRGRDAANQERESAWRISEFKFLSSSALAPASSWTADPCSRYSRALYVGLDRDTSLRIDYSLWSVSSPVCEKTHVPKDGSDAVIIPDRIRLLLRLPVLASQ